MNGVKAVAFRWNKELAHYIAESKRRHRGRDSSVVIDERCQKLAETGDARIIFETMVH